MLISISKYYPLIISLQILLILLFLGYLFLVKEQNKKLNWALFYSSLYVTVMLPIVNYICVNYGLWNFTDPQINSIQLPFDLYFIWVVIWGLLPFLLLKGKYFFLVSIAIFWLDVITMPILEQVGVLHLNKNWLIGEIALIGTVFMPAYYWAFCSYNSKFSSIRAFLQVVTMAAIFLIGLPFIFLNYGLIKPINLYYAPYTFQLLLIIVFPSLVAVLDLVQKGEGTPFPYDPTKNIVRTGVYAYCQNPIQWSFTLMFIPLSIYYSSFFFLLGSVFSIAYTIGVSDVQEHSDMENRFGKEWQEYKKDVPKWMFLWRPKSIPKGQVFFDRNCKQCSQISMWFENSKAINLDIRTSTEFPNSSNILQVTYIDHNGKEYKSIKAIAHCLEHINLVYACLGWFMRFPAIQPLLQVIIDTMEFDAFEDECNVNTNKNKLL